MLIALGGSATAADEMDATRKAVALAELDEAARVLAEHAEHDTPGARAALPGLIESISTQALGRVGDAPEAVLGLADVALRAVERHFGPFAIDADAAQTASMFGVYALRGTALSQLGQTRAAIAAFDDALTVFRAVPDIDPADLALFLHHHADLLESLDYLTAAADTHAVAHTLKAAALGPGHIETAASGCEVERLAAWTSFVATAAPVDCEALLARAIAYEGPAAQAARHAALAAAWQGRGRIPEAIEHADAAIDKALQVDGGAMRVAERLRARAVLDATIGDDSSALARLALAVEIAQPLMDTGEAVTWLTHVVPVSAAFDQYEGASHLIDGALQLLPTPHQRTVLTFQRGMIADAQGRFEAAAADYAVAAALLDRMGDHPSAAWWRSHMAGNAQVRGERLNARTSARAALSAVARLPASTRPWVAALRYAELARDAGRATAAIFFAKRAVAALHALRGRLADQRDAFDAHYQTHYQTLAELLVTQRGRLAEAQAVTALLHVAELAEYTRGARAGRATDEVGVPRSGAELGWWRRYDAAVAQLRAADRAQRVDAERGFEALLDTLEREMQAAGERGRRHLDDATRAALRARQALLTALDAERPGRVALVHVILGRARSHLLVTTADDQWAVAIDADAATLNQRAEALYTALSSSSAYRAQATALYTDLVTPLRAGLVARGVDTLLWSLDGALRYVPMAALVDPETGEFLVQQFATARFVDAVALPADRARRPLDRVAAFGASHGGAGLAPLPAVPLEIGAIVRAFGEPTTGVIDGEVWLDGDFTANALRAALGGEAAAPIVHIASHFAFRPGPAELSFLLLGDGAPLSLGALVDARFDGVELLTLSACQTAVGTFAEGQPLDGFAALALRQGAASVVASLWPVLDHSTALLMARFYEQLAAGAHKIDALRSAQLAALGEAGAGPARLVTLPTQAAPAPTRPHPYVWAAFVLSGDPR